MHRLLQGSRQQTMTTEKSDVSQTVKTAGTQQETNMQFSMSRTT